MGENIFINIKKLGNCTICDPLYGGCALLGAEDAESLSISYKNFFTYKEYVVSRVSRVF